MATFMGQLQADILDTHKALSDLNESMAIALQDSSKWTIASRFLSGTGLWAVQNKIRGIVSVVAEYQKGTTQLMEKQKKNAELMDKLADRTEHLTNARNALSDATNDALDIQQQFIDNQNALTLAEEALDRARRDGNATADLRAQVNLQRELVQEHEEHYRLATKASEEIDRMREYYAGIEIPDFDIDDIRMGGSAVSTNIMTSDEAIGDEKIAEFLDYRMRVMQKIADDQEEALTGGDFGKQMQARMEQLEMIEFNLSEELGEVSSIFGGIGAVQGEGLEQDYRDVTTLGERMANSIIVGLGGGTDFLFGGDAAEDVYTAKYQKRILAFEKLKLTIQMKMQTYWLKMKKIGKFVKDGAAIFGKALLYLPIFVLGIFVIVQALKELWPGIQKGFETFMAVAEIGFGIVKDGFMNIWSGIQTIWEGIMDGNIFAVLFGLLEIGFGILQVSFGLAMVVIGGLVSFIVGFAWGIVTGWFTKSGSIAGAILRAIITIGTLFYTVQFLLALNTALTNPGMWGPVLIATGMVALFALAKWFLSRFDFFYQGGVSTGGLAIVGEQGPEMVKLPAGARVKNNKDTMTTLRATNNTNQSKSASVTNNINVHVNGRVGASDSEIRDIARKVGAQINREINRKTSSGTRA